MPYQFTVSPQQYLKSEDVSRFPAGMRNNNPGNLKYSGSKWQQKNFSGMLGPSENKDEGSPQIVFDSPQSGIAAMNRLIKGKYESGMDTVHKLIQGQGGWTPGPAGAHAPANIAKTMGVGPHDKIDLSDPKVMASFSKALITQEHGTAGAAYHSLVDGTAAPAGAPATAAAPAGAPMAPSAPAGNPELAALDVAGRPGAFSPEDTEWLNTPQQAPEQAAAPQMGGGEQAQAPAFTETPFNPSPPVWAQDQAPGRNYMNDKMMAAQAPRRGLLGAEEEALNTEALMNNKKSRFLPPPSFDLRGLLG